MQENNEMFFNENAKDKGLYEDAVIAYRVVKETPIYNCAKLQGDFTYEDYCNLPDNIRVELIDGVFFYMDSPHINHQVVGGEIYRQISNYIHDKKGTCIPFMAPVDVILDKDNKTCVQPDVGILCNKDLIDNRGHILGAPDFVLEVISKSTSKKDYTIKLEKYRNAGVKEYWIVDYMKEKVFVYYFENEPINPQIYAIGDPIPVNIYGGELIINMVD